MKRLATKLFKLRTQGTLVNFVWGENVEPQTREDFEKFIKENLHAHANRMYLYKTLHPRMVKHNQYVARKRLHMWLNNLEHGVVNYL